MRTRLPAVAAIAVAAMVAVSAQNAPREVDLVVTGGTVVTVDAAGRIIEQGAVAIDGADIAAVDTAEAIAKQFRGRDTIDASGQIVMPGLVNTHTHAPMVLYRGLADDLPLTEWLNNYIFPAESRTVSPEFVRAGTRLAALEMIESGTTTFADMYYFEEEIARETRRAGLRAVLGQTVIQFSVPDAKTPGDALARADAFIAEFKSDPLITPAVAPHAIYTLDGPTLRAARELSKRHNVPTLIHVAETNGETRVAQERRAESPVAYLDSLGFLGQGVVAAHGIWVTDADIQTLRMRGVGVSHNPESNMKLASGTAPVQAYLRAGVPVGLGTDGAASNNDLDMFEAMRVTALLHKHESVDPAALPARTILEMATIRGARALGLDARIGSLEPKKRADLITISTSGARQTPMYDPISHLVYVIHGDDVQNSVVNGRVLMRNRKVQTLNAAAIVAEAREWAVKVRAAVKQPAATR
ncbi:MAG TPA: amidohydrolase [Vicinamibacterales bacterium]|nr:amidohydrolase [Vicinamibacterales bacterium]